VSEQPTPLKTAVEVRSLTEDDLEDVLQIERASFSTPWYESTFRGLLRRADTDMVAALAEGRLVGYAACWTVVDQAELGNLAVAESARGRNVGRTLLAAAMERLRRRGARECFLEVRESNHPAQTLYRQHGFEVVGRRRSYYSRPVEDALVMRLALRDAARS
jgi:ribosomal-protein-alanine N-acetyltransferase